MRALCGTALRSSAHEYVWEPGRAVPLGAILGILRRGAGDPTMVVDGRQLWWAPLTPHGPVASWWRNTPAANGDRIRVEAHGPGAAWLLARVPVILGNEDDVSAFRAHHPLVARAWQQPEHYNWRVAKTGMVINSLIPSILEQKVTGQQAFGAFRHLVRTYGQPALFPESIIQQSGRSARKVADMRHAPMVEVWRRIPSWQWLKAGVEPSASATIMRVLEVAPGLERAADLPLEQAHARLRSVPGIGVWTAAKVAQTGLGDADAPTFGDFHIAKRIGWAFDGRDGDDARMAELLEPYRGHRYRAERIVLSAGEWRGARGARLETPRHLPTWTS